MDKIIKLSYDRDMCPDNDSVISQVTCKNCNTTKVLNYVTEFNVLFAVIIQAVVRRAPNNKTAGVIILHITNAH